MPSSDRRHHPRSVPVVRRFTVRERYGFNPYLCCWCGAELEMDYSQRNDRMTRHLNDFLDAHEDCTPKQQEEETAHG